MPNALALGRDPKSATLVVTTGLERSLGLVELEGVLAHELVHIKRNDTVLSAVAVVVALPVAVVRGTAAAAETVHGLVGRGREFSADQRAALVVRYPTGIGCCAGTMAAAPSTGEGWPPAPGRTAALTRWLWVDPMAGVAPGDRPRGTSTTPGSGPPRWRSTDRGRRPGRAGPPEVSRAGQASPASSPSHGGPWARFCSRA